MNRVRWGVTVAICSTFLGCGGGTKSENGGYDYTTPRAYCQAVWSAVCEREKICGENIASDCAVYNAHLCGRYDLTRSTLLAAGRIAPNLAGMESCLADIAQAPCTLRNKGVLCDSAHSWIGAVPVGGACTLDAECVDGGRCNRSMACPGICEARASEGASCASIECKPPLVCGSTDVCVPPPVEGQACVNEECANGLRCNAQNVCTATLPGSGEPCDAGSCQDGLYCHNDTCQPYRTQGQSCATGTCAPELRCAEAPTQVCQLKATVGQVCRTFSDCAAGLVCDHEGSAGHCVALVGQDMPCAPVMGGYPDQSNCSDGLVCLSGTCKPRPKLGEACHPTLNPCDYNSQYCDTTTSTCVLQKLGNESCTNNDECLSRECGADNRCTVDCTS